MPRRQSGKHAECGIAFRVARNDCVGWVVVFERREGDAPACVRFLHQKDIRIGFTHEVYQAIWIPAVIPHVRLKNAQIPLVFAGFL